jgi:hypothetical protein
VGWGEGRHGGVKKGEVGNVTPHFFFFFFGPRGGRRRL